MKRRHSHRNKIAYQPGLLEMDRINKQYYNAVCNQPYADWRPKTLRIGVAALERLMLFLHSNALYFPRTLTYKTLNTLFGMQVIEEWDDVDLIEVQTRNEVRK